eukprot:evm.model.scf_672.8 EVM.evm.TU.scf_672.8   scf_672:41445-45927(-)
MDANEEPFSFDARFQFDAPRIRDFAGGTPIGHRDDWFSRHLESPVSPRGGKTGVENVRGDGAESRSAAQAKGQPSSSQPQVIRQLLPSQDSDLGEPGGPSNMVASWDHVRLSTAKQGEGKIRAGCCTESRNQQGSKRAAKKPLQCASQPPAKVARIGQAAARKIQSTAGEARCNQAMEAATREPALRKNASTGRAVLQPRAIQLHRSTKAQTVPKEFMLRTDSRSRHHAMTTRSMLHEASCRGLVQPPEETATCMERVAPSCKYKPLSQQLAEFEKTPDRFKPLPPGQHPPVLPPKFHPAPTIPQSPKLRTAARCRARRAADGKQKEVAQVGFTGLGPQRCPPRHARPLRMAAAGVTKRQGRKPDKP